MEDETIIELLYVHDDNGLNELSNKYQKLLYKVSFNILLDESDTEECINDTYMKVWNTIPPYKPTFLKSFICKIIRQISIDRYRVNHKKSSNIANNIAIEELSYEISSKTSVENELLAKTLINDINNYLDNLDVENQVIFIRRYFLEESIQEISKRYEISESKVGVKLFRTRNDLKKYLLRKGYNIENN